MCTLNERRSQKQPKKMKANERTNERMNKEWCVRVIQIHNDGEQPQQRHQHYQQIR